METKYAVGDEVIINDRDNDDHHWAFYLHGSKGIIDEIRSSGAYHLEFIEAVDAHPKERSTNGFDWNFIINNHSLLEDDLDPATEPLVTPYDNGFEDVF